MSSLLEHICGSSCCPCPAGIFRGDNSSDEEIATRAKAAAFALQSVPVVWYREVRSTTVDGNGASSSRDHVGVEATLAVVDGGSSGPSMRVTGEHIETLPKSHEFADGCEPVGKAPHKDDTVYGRTPAKHVPLNIVEEVCPVSAWSLSYLMGYEEVGDAKKRADCGIRVRGGREGRLGASEHSSLLEFDIVSGDSGGVSRDEVVWYLNALVEWTRRRPNGGEAQPGAAAPDRDEKDYTLM